SEALGPDFDVVRKDSTVVVIDMKSDPFQNVRLKKLLRSKADTSRVLQSGNLPSRDRELILNQLGKVFSGMPRDGDMAFHIIPQLIIRTT
ncbi:hypothetical protein ABTL91_19340, partial [Acinetobacter baumannii]